MFILRGFCGFFAVVQPMAYTIISDQIPPANRIFANSLNNMSFFAASLVAVLLNAFVFPYIKGFYSTTDNYITYRSTMYVSAVSFFISFICSFFIKETCPAVLMKKECKKMGVVYKENKADSITWGQAVKMVFCNKNMLLTFISYVLGYGTSVSNQNVASYFISKFMHFTNTVDAQIYTSVVSLIGIFLAIIVIYTCY